MSPESPWTWESLASTCSMHNLFDKYQWDWDKWQLETVIADSNSAWSTTDRQWRAVLDDSEIWSKARLCKA
jgi:hypothetical protein